MIAVARNAMKATQFCGSAMVNVPTGGRKKKLKQSTAAIEPAVASMMPQPVAISRIAIRYESATVVGLTRRISKYRAVMSTTAPIEAAIRPIVMMPRTVQGGYLTQPASSIQPRPPRALLALLPGDARLFDRGVIRWRYEQTVPDPRLRQEPFGTGRLRFDLPPQLIDDDAQRIDVLST